MAKRMLLLLTWLACVCISPAKEGMWLPLLLENLESDMQASGLKLSAEDIYSINQSSLKDAVVRFGGGCTGELISPQGLLLTNHHCGFGSIQRRSTLENDYVTDGFWAMSRAGELPNPGLSVTFIVRIEDVTEGILSGLPAGLGEEARDDSIELRMVRLEKAATAGTHYEAEIKPFFYGNEFYLFVKEVFQDVRLVGAPPSSIGKYGGDTDNWVWPRHTGDFSLFRVYSGPDGKPAPYSEENIPLQPRHHLPISLKGVQPGDFTMVYGFPGRTQEYLSAEGVRLIAEVQDPARIALRERRLQVMDEFMAADPAVKLAYIADYNSLANYYKKWQGELLGLERKGTLAEKAAFEAEFAKRIGGNPAWQEAYGGVVAALASHYRAMQPGTRSVTFFEEGGYGIEAVQLSMRLLRSIANMEEDSTAARRAEEQEGLRAYAETFFAEYHAPLDQAITATVLQYYHDALAVEDRPDVVQQIDQQFDGDFGRYAAELFEQSRLLEKASFLEMVEAMDLTAIQQDPAFNLTLGLYRDFFRHYYTLSPHEQAVDSLNRIFMQAQREVFAERDFYPDANSTLRLSYGKVEGYQPMDGVNYQHYTTLDGVIEKYQPGDREFDLPAKILELHRARDYGPYANAEGELPVAFTASNHTTGGNSGSPVLNGEGQLIGLNFDRNWRATVSDLDYDPAVCRNISVDVRYVLFLVDKFAGAGYLVEEMTLVE